MKAWSSRRTVLRRMRDALCLAFSAAVLVLGSGGCRGTNFLSTKDEVRLGKDASAEVEKRYRVLTNTAESRRVATVGSRILDHCEKREGVPYFVKTLEVKDVNAVSLPGGPIYVYTGLLDFIGDDDDALACIIGHEAGHIDARHSAKQISQQMVANVGILLVLRGKTAQDIGALTTDLLNLSYSREDEYEADHRGVSYAHKAGYKATGMVEFFKKLQKLEKKGAGLEILRSHPYASQRLARVEKIIETQDYRYGR